MRKLYPATRFLVGAVLEEAVSNKDYRQQVLVLPPKLGAAPPASVIDSLEAVARREGDRVNEDMLAKAMLGTGVLNIDDVLRYTKCFDGKVRQTRNATFDRVKHQLFNNFGGYVPYAGQEEFKKYVGFHQPKRDDQAGSVYRIQYLQPNGLPKLLKIDKQVETAISVDMHEVAGFGGVPAAEPQAAVVTPLTPSDTIVPEAAQQAVEKPAAQPSTPVSPAAKEVEDMAAQVPGADKDGSAADSKVAAQQAEEQARVATGNPSQPTTDAVANNEPVAPEATVVSDAGKDSIAAGTAELAAVADESEGGGAGIGALTAQARSSKTGKTVDELMAKYEAGDPLKQTYNLKVSDVVANKAKLVEMANSKSQFGKKLEAMIQDMFSKATNYRSAKLGILLTGDPGVGKTTFINQFGDAVGLPVISIEAPHITKEHIINIPFLVKDPFMAEPKRFDATLLDADKNPNDDKHEWRVENAESHIVTEMIRARKRRDSKYTEEFWVSKIESRPQIDKVFDTTPRLLKQAKICRKKFSCIFFVDEFFRTDDPNIRNILRGIINGKVGNDQLPDDVYTVYAANLKHGDESFDEIPSNMQFGGTINFDNPTPQEWGDYFTSKFGAERASAVELRNRIEAGEATQDEIESYQASAGTQALANFNVAIDEDLTNAIVGAVGEDLAKDTKDGLRLSPRRMDQIVLCVNAFRELMKDNDFNEMLKFPAASAQSIINAFLRVQLRDYATGKVNDAVWRRMGQAVAAKLGYTFDPSDVAPSTDWGRQVQTQLMLKQKLGSFRKYPLVVAGEPGIGKTQIMNKSCSDIKMPVISIEASNLTKSSVIGMPISRKMTESDIATRKEQSIDTGYDGEARRVTDAELQQLAAESGIDTRKATEMLRALESGRTTDFAPPPMYRLIMKWYFEVKRGFQVYERDEKEGVAAGSRRGSPRPSGKYQVMLFIDELTRVEDKSIFNILRKVLLENEFGDGNRLPDDMMVSAALNPTDLAEASTQKLSDHMKDVLDIIPADANWVSWMDTYLLPTAKKLYDAEKAKRVEAAQQGMDAEELDLMYPLTSISTNIAELTAKALNYIAEQMRIGQLVGKADAKDAKDMLVRYPMVGRADEKFFWMNATPTAPAIYISPRNMAALHEKMFTLVLEDSSTGQPLVENVQQIMASGEADDTLYTPVYEGFQEAYIRAFDMQIREQLATVQRVTPTGIAAVTLGYESAVRSAPANNIYSQVFGVVEKPTSTSLVDYIEKWGTEEIGENFDVGVRIQALGLEFVPEFDEAYGLAIDKCGGEYTVMLSAMWSVVKNADKAIGLMLKDKNAGSADVLMQVLEGIKGILAKRYKTVLIELLKDGKMIDLSLVDKSFDEQFTQPNLEWMADRI